MIIDLYEWFTSCNRGRYTFSRAASFCLLLSCLIPSVLCALNLSFYSFEKLIIISSLNYNFKCELRLHFRHQIIKILECCKAFIIILLPKLQKSKLIIQNLNRDFWLVLANIKKNYFMPNDLKFKAIIKSIPRKMKNLKSFL